MFTSGKGYAMLDTKFHNRHVIPYRLKFSRVKIFEDFEDLSGLENFSLESFDPSKTPLKTYFQSLLKPALIYF